MISNCEKSNVLEKISELISQTTGTFVVGNDFICVPKMVLLLVQ
jgi:hypothetical protein